MTRHVLELAFPAEARYLVLARLGVAGVAPAARLDPDEIADLKLAITEACANAVRHAYPDDFVGDVLVRIALDDGSLTVEIADTGRGIVADATVARSLDGMRENGMGLSIIRSVVDELEIDSPESGGTIVRFTKHPAAA